MEKTTSLDKTIKAVRLQRQVESSVPCTPSFGMAVLLDIMDNEKDKNEGLSETLNYVDSGGMEKPLGELTMAGYCWRRYVPFSYYNFALSSAVPQKDDTDAIQPAQSKGISQMLKYMDSGGMETSLGELLHYGRILLAVLSVFLSHYNIALSYHRFPER